MDVVLLKIVPALIAPAMLMLLMSQGAASTSILLNGLSIAFVLHLDSTLPYVFLTATEQQAMTSFFTRVASHAGGIRLAGQPTAMQTYRIYEGPVRLVSSLIAFGRPFAHVTAVGGGITCETMGYYLFYRAGVTLGLWLPYGARELLELLARCLALGSLHLQDADAARQRVKPELRLMLAGFVARFGETLFCAVAMNLTFGVFCELFWDMEWGRFFRDFLWGFVRDVFGACAASGYADVWEYPCIPLDWTDHSGALR